MPLRLAYLLHNLVRNPLRSGLTVAAVALPITIFVLSTAVIEGLNVFLNDSARQLRLAVAHKTSIINPLPYGHKLKIESLDPGHKDILAVVGVAWIGGTVENNQTPLTTLAVSAEDFVVAFTDHLLTPEERSAWLRDRQALIVGRATAAQMGWEVGMRVTIKASVPPYNEFQFNVVSTAPEAIDPVANWCHLSYLMEEREKYRLPPEAVSAISFYYVKCASAAALDRFRAEIDALFRNTPDETQTQDEKAFLNQFITQQFNLPRNLRLFAGITIAVAILAAANTMNMSFRDRVNEFAALKAMGFSGSFVAGLIQAESLLLCCVGGLIGAFAPYVAFMHTPLRAVSLPVIQQLDITAAVCLNALAVALGIGVFAAFWPAWQALGMRVVAALRNLE